MADISASEARHLIGNCAELLGFLLFLLLLFISQRQFPLQISFFFCFTGKSSSFLKTDKNWQFLK